jgi:hypothetical protein
LRTNLDTSASTRRRYPRTWRAKQTALRQSF